MHRALQENMPLFIDKSQHHIGLEASVINPSDHLPPCFFFFFGLVRIRPLRSVLTISEPWDEGDGFE